MKKVLVTGASGFLGANLVHALYNAGYAVKIIVRENAALKGLGDVPCEIYYGNITDATDIEHAVQGCNIVVHAACITDQWGVSFDEYERVNFLATKYIADVCVLNNIEKLVYVSSANTIGPGKKQEPGTELHGFTLFNANSGYINSKYMAQQYVLEITQSGKLNATVVNPTFMIGPNDVKPSSGKLMLYSLNKKVLFYPPGGKNFVYIHDVCNGIINAIHKGKAGQCYLLAGHNLTYKEFFRIVSDEAKEKKVMIPMPGFILKIVGRLGSLVEFITGSAARLNYTAAYLICLDNYYSGKKSEKELGVQYTSMPEAVSKALTWFKENNYYKSRV